MITAECENDDVAEEEEEEEEEVFEPIPSDEFIDVLREFTKNYQFVTGAAGVGLGGENQLTNNAANMVRYVARLWVKQCWSMIIFNSC